MKLWKRVFGGQRDIQTMLAEGDLAGLISALDDPQNHVWSQTGCSRAAPELASAIVSFGEQAAGWLAESAYKLNQDGQTAFMMGDHVSAQSLLQRRRLRVEVLAMLPGLITVRPLLDALADGIEIGMFPSLLALEARCLARIAYEGLADKGDLVVQPIEKALPHADAAIRLGLVEHSSLQMSQHYARLYDSTVKDQFESAAGELEGVVVRDWPVPAATPVPVQADFQQVDSV
jgi:hypothetical protein